MYYRREYLNDFVRSSSNASITSWQQTQHTQCANYEWHETRDREIVWSLGEGELTILLFQHIAKRRKEKKRYYYFHYTKREPPFTFNSGNVKKSYHSKQFTSLFRLCRATFPSEQEKEAIYRNPLHIDDEKADFFSLNPLSYAQVCIYAWQALRHLRRTRFFMRSVYFSPFCFDALTNGISAFSRTSAKVYSLTRTPSSNTVWRRSCHKFKIRTSQS